MAYFKSLRVYVLGGVGRGCYAIADDLESEKLEYERGKLSETHPLSVKPTNGYSKIMLYRELLKVQHKLF